MAENSSIQKEIKQTRPFQSARQEGVIALLRTASLIRRHIDALMLPHGITGQQYNVLRILRGAGEPLPTMEVAQRMIEVEPGITRMFERLEKKGLVRRDRCVHDGRRMLCSITPEGLRILTALEEKMSAQDEEMLANLTDNQTQQLIALLDKAREPLQKSCDAQQANSQ